MHVSPVGWRRRGAWRAALTAGAMVVLPAAWGGVETDHDPGADFSRYATWAWKPGHGVPAGKPEVQRFIVEAVERELSGSGLRKVEADPDVWAVTYTGTGVDYGNTAPYLQGGTWAKGVHSFGVQEVTKGSVVVTLIDAASDKPVWRSEATESIKTYTVPDLPKIRRKIDKAVRKMFRAYPP